MFQKLPAVFTSRHCWIVPRLYPGARHSRMSENLKINGWALNTEYFSEIMHLLRRPSETLIYRHVVERLVEYPSGADTRDTEAVLRLCTAYIKLLFPHVTIRTESTRGSSNDTVYVPPCRCAR